MFKKLVFYPLVIILFLFSPAFTFLADGQTLIFGPEFYTRGKGKPQKVVKNFYVQNLNQKFTLSVQNGEGDWGRVSSAVIELNGIRVFSPDDFNKQVRMITKLINLQQQNTITVEVRSEPGTSLGVTIFGELPSIGSTITPSGGTVSLEGYASITFPSGAFTANQNVIIAVTSSPETQVDYNESGSILKAGPRLPYEIRINSGHTAPETSFDMTLHVPDSFIATMPLNVKMRVFVQIYQDKGEEVLDNFEMFPSTFDPIAKTIRVTLPKEVFTNLRHLEDTYESIVIVGATFK